MWPSHVIHFSSQKVSSAQRPRYTPWSDQPLRRLSRIQQRHPANCPCQETQRAFKPFQTLNRKCSSPFALSFHASLVQLHSCLRNDRTDLPAVLDRAFKCFQCVTVHFPVSLVDLAIRSFEMSLVDSGFCSRTRTHILNLWRLMMALCVTKCRVASATWDTVR